MAAVLACGEGALLSHRDAATLWRLLPTSSSNIHVAVPGRSRVGPPGILLHLPRRSAAEDRSIEDGIPVTSVARTLLDLAEVAPRRHLERALEQAERLELFDLRAVERLIDRSHGHHGLRALNASLRDYRETPLTRSELERAFLELCEEAGLPRPQVNICIAGMEVDMVWPEHRLVVELDGHDFHRTRIAFERDRARDAILQVAGYRVLRITYRRLVRAPEGVVHAVRSLLDRV
jgi:very-short-patch-repair endonuclease